MIDPFFAKGKDTGMNRASESEKTHPGLEEIEKAEVRAYFNEARRGTCVEVGANEPVAPTSQSLHLALLNYHPR